MNDHFKTASDENGLSEGEIRETLLAAVAGRDVRKVLIVPPDFTRFHSNAGLITRIYYEHFTALGANVDILPALGTHFAVSETQWNAMFTGIPLISFIGFGLYIYTMFRMLSRNNEKRIAENRKYIALTSGWKTKSVQFTKRLKNRKDYKYFKCPNCKVLLRLKRGCGEKDITCVRCGHQFKQKA